MTTYHHIWQVWARSLHRWGVQDLAASLLEAAGPLTLLGAQFLYMGQPLLNPLLPEGQLKALAELLEEPARAQSFAAFLREDLWRESA